MVKIYLSQESFRCDVPPIQCAHATLFIL
jgi:hypothetical protein